MISDFPAMTSATFALAFAAVMVGSGLQRLAGQGFGSTAAPLLALVAPGHLPAVVLLLGAVTASLSATFDFSSIDWRRIAPALVGRAAGAMAAVAVIAAAPGPDQISVAVALAVLTGVVLSLSGLRLAITDASLTGAGFLSGLMGTVTGVGAPPMGLLYQHEAARKARATLNAFFLIGLAFSLAAIIQQGLVRREDLVLSLTLLPAILIGAVAASYMAGKVANRALRPFAIGLATLAAIGLLIRVLW